MPQDALALDATGQLERLKAGHISARALLEASIERYEATHQRINAVVSTDLPRARRDADRIDALRASGTTLGALAGLPMTIKDAFDVEGLPASSGLPELLQRNPPDADTVKRFRDAGAIIWGKTNTPMKAADFQTFNSLYGTTNNPWDVTRTPGGSSGGSAAAVAAGLTALELGADIGGSLRIPASYCGICTHKPTWGLLSQNGLQPKGTADIDLAVVGPMARSTRDLKLAVQVLAGVGPESPQSTRDVRSLRLAVWTEEPGFLLDTDVSAVMESTIRKLESAGISTTRCAAPVRSHDLMWTYGTLLLSLSSREMGIATRTALELLRGPALFARAIGAPPFSWAHGVLAYSARHREWMLADEMRANLRQELNQFLSGYDALIMPVSPIAAYKHDHTPLTRRRQSLASGITFSATKLLEWVALATACGNPATVIPAGITAQGLPVGIQIVGRTGRDVETINVAHLLEQLLGGFQPPPGM
jgi:amidase